jgi:Tfp pilus assembly protein PilO
MNPKIFIVFLIVLLISVWNFSINPLFDGINALKEEIIVQEAFVKTKKLEIAKLKSHEKQLSLLTEEKEKVEIAIPSEPKEEEIMLEVEALVIRSGMALDTLSIGLSGGNNKKDESSEVQKISIGIRASGSYDALKRFFALSYRDLRIMYIENVTFSPPNDQESEGEVIYDFTINIKTYYY